MAFPAWVRPLLLRLPLALMPLLWQGFGAQAQTAPDARQVAAYRGLHVAAHHGDLAALREALQRDPKAVTQRDEQGRTAVHIATFAGQREALRVLAAAGADLNALEHQRYDAVTIAAVANDPATLAELLRLGASARQTTSPYDGTALIAAAHLGHVEVVRQLLQAGAPVDHVNNLHWTALIEAVVLGDGGPRHTEVVRQLLAAGANRNLTDRQGKTAEALARERGHANQLVLLQNR